MNHQKTLSVIIPVYNQEQLIKIAINSIPKRDDVEIIVIDDFSQDKTVQSVQSLKRDDITLIKLNKRKSIGFCRNLGLKNSSGQFAFWLDSDDYVDTKKFNSFMDFVNNHKWVDLIHIDLMDNRGVFYSGPNSCGTPTKVMNIDTLNKYNLMFKDITVGEDLILWNSLKVKPIIVSHYKELFYHYNYPREGSTTWLAQRKIIEEDWRKYV